MIRHMAFTSLQARAFLALGTLIQSHREAKQAREILNENIEANAVFAAEHLRAALEFFGQVTGRTYHEELLDSIFSRFCIGK